MRTPGLDNLRNRDSKTFSKTKIQVVARSDICMDSRRNSPLIFAGAMSRLICCSLSRPPASTRRRIRSSSRSLRCAFPFISGRMCFILVILILRQHLLAKKYRELCRSHSNGRRKMIASILRDVLDYQVPHAPCGKTQHESEPLRLTFCLICSSAVARTRF